MKKNSLLITVIISILIALFFYSGCGDGDQGPAGTSTLSSLRININLSDGKTASAYKVDISRTGSSGETVQSSDESGNGYYIFTNLTPGTYKVKVQSPGYIPQELSATVNSGTTDPVTVTLKKGIYGIGLNIIGGKNTSSDVLSSSDMLYIIDPNTGECHEIGSTGCYNTRGIDVNPTDGQLYGFGHGMKSMELYTINPYTGEGTKKADVTGTTRIQDITFSSDGTLYTVLTTSLSSKKQYYLATINLSTGLVKKLNETTAITEGHDDGDSIGIASGDSMYMTYEHTNELPYEITVSPDGTGTGEAAISGADSEDQLEDQLIGTDFMPGTQDIYGVYDSDNDNKLYFIKLTPGASPVFTKIAVNTNYIQCIACP